MRKLEQLIDIPFELASERAVSAYTDDVTIMGPKASEVDKVGTILKEYELITRAKFNTHKSVRLQLGFCRGRTKQLDRDVGSLTYGPVKLPRVWLCHDLHVDK